jgi:hypothetical protein
MLGRTVDLRRSINTGPQENGVLANQPLRSAEINLFQGTDI